ncbi:MAG: ImmA/IrrE family metallo-endopeptidase [Bryobacterales bacterium]|nr:ImmA/IrrE family metallo-endopeptidase [Bryobacterales bacterium]
MGLRVQEVPASGFDGALVRSMAGQKGIIAVKATIREASRKRFTVAHEIGHFVIPHHCLLKTVCDEKKIDSFDAKLDRPEIEANEFAAELLLPSTVLSKKFSLQEFSLREISTVATEFETSLTATVRCFLRLTGLPCAMVWSSDNQARWCARSEAFRFYLPLAERPADGSFATRLFKGGVVPADFAVVPAEMWLDRQVAESVGTLLELIPSTCRTTMRCSRCFGPRRCQRLVPRKKVACWQNSNPVTLPLGDGIGLDSCDRRATRPHCVGQPHTTAHQ